MDDVPPEGDDHHDCSVRTGSSLDEILVYVEIQDIVIILVDTYLFVFKNPFE